MPGSVAVAAPSTVLPAFLARMYRHDREYAALLNHYKNGESQRSKLTETSRKVFTVQFRVTAAALAILRTFYDARRGPWEAFWMYYPWETSPKFTHDPTGVATTGRYTVRLATPWEQHCFIARAEAGFTLVEIYRQEE